MGVELKDDVVSGGDGIKRDFMHYPLPMSLPDSIYDIPANRVEMGGERHTRKDWRERTKGDMSDIQGK
jgi:hypothetical protein